MIQVIEALRYNSEGREFDSLWCQWTYHSHNRSGRATAMGLTEPLTDIRTRNISWGQRWPVCKADKLAKFMCRLS